MVITERSQPRHRPPGSAGDPAIEVRGLRKRYGESEVLRGIDLVVRKGEVFAFLGPNGAGKTTTVEILEGFRSRTGGHVAVLGHDPAVANQHWRGRVGVVLQASTPERNLTVRETVDLYGGFYPSPLPTERVLAMTGLSGEAATRNRRLSGGQQRRLDVALALVGDPEVLFLDEPTTGFDPAARRAAWDTIAGLRDLGKTVFLTTHYLEEAEVLADRIAVLVGGRIVATGPPAELGGRRHRPSNVSFTAVTGQPPPPLSAGATSSCKVSAGGRWAFHTSEPTSDLAALLAWSGAQGITLHDLEVRRPSLEQIYIDLTDGGSDG